MATLTKQKFSDVGDAPVYDAADVAGDEFDNSTGTNYLLVDNASAGSVTVTVDSVKLCSFGFDHDLEETISAGNKAVIGPLPRARFNDENDMVQISYDAVTDVTVAVVDAS